MATEVDPIKYAENLRKQLVQELLDGEDLDKSLENVQEDYSFSDFAVASSEVSLQDLDKDLETFQDHEIIRGILEHGRVLKEYTRDIDDKLRQVELESIQDYIQESDNMVALHEQIKNCDGILSQMEQVLGRFQSELGKASEEIRQLQVQSQSMNIKLKNRRATEVKLGSFVEQLTISEELVSNIFDAEVGEDYMEHLLALDRKLAFIEEDEVARISRGKRDVEPALERLRLKAIMRLRDFLMNKIYALKRPKTNVQIIQQSVLLKYKYFVRFLRDHGGDVYDEVRSEYGTVMSRILAQHFRTYLSSMEKMVIVVAGQADVVGLSEGATTAGNMMALFKGTAARQPGANTERVFELGDRATILGQLDQSALVAPMVEAEGRRFPFEVLFRNVNKLLLDTATSEYAFCCDFFDDPLLFKELYNPIISLVENELTGFVQELWDILAVLLVIRINQEHRKVLAKRRVRVLDDYFDRINMIMWPRFKVLFDHHLYSVRVGTERTLYTGELGVHMVSRKYAALTISMMLLMAAYDSGEDAIFQAQTYYDMHDRLWSSLFDLLLRMSNMFREKRSGIIFLIVNYSHISCVLRQHDSAQVSGVNPSGTGTGGAGASVVGGALGRTGATAMKECEEQLTNCTALYVEDQLSVYFKDLLEFVKRAEQQQKRLAIPEGQPIPGFGAAQAGPVLRDFSSRWKAAIMAMHKEVMKQFSDALCGRDVLQASMTSLLKYYTRMLELLKRQGAEGMTLAKESVNIPSIMYEIKNITKS